MAVSVFHPKVSVVLKKNIGRSTVAGGLPASQRFTGTDRVIDLTPFLGENSHVVVRKSVRAPAGMFSVTLADKMPSFEAESLYALIEPMDVIEIRMARDTSIYAGMGYEASMPLMMRGFVTEISREEVMAGGLDARPSRVVVVSGQDYGKILTMMQIAYLPNMVTGQNLTTAFKFYENYGVGSQVLQPASEFVEDVVTKVINPFIGDMIQATTSQSTSGGSSPVSMFQIDATVQDGVVSAFGTQQWPGGTVWGLLAYYGDVGPWNELFVQDREDAPYIVYRPNPFKDASGNFIQTITSPPMTNSISDADIISISSGRSDENVANYYWVDAPRYQLNDGKLLQVSLAMAAQKDAFYLTDYDNCSPSLYGFRQMLAQSQQGPRFDLQKEAQYEQISGDFFAFLSKRRQVLMDSNKDNVVWESGRVVFMGNEGVQAGTFLDILRGTLTSECYVVDVVHDFQPFHSYTTTATYERGNGFISRSQIGGGSASPYWTELSVGGVYG